MNQLNEDIKYCEELVANSPQDIYIRLLSYLKELKMYRIEKALKINEELGLAKAQLQLRKSELEIYNKMQITRQFQDLSQITQQGN